MVLRDGTKIAGDFTGGEITGNGVKIWPNGRIYHGQFTEGEMNGHGKLVYSESEKRNPD